MLLGNGNKRETSAMLTSYPSAIFVIMESKMASSILARIDKRSCAVVRKFFPMDFKIALRVSLP